jgi:hypothetical protein
VNNDNLSPLLLNITKPLDRFRRGLLFQFSKWLYPFVGHRARRVTVTACILLTLSFLFSVTIPCWQLALGPIIFGIPHIVGDVRYLVIQEKLHTRMFFWVAVVFPLLLYIYNQQPVYGAFAILGAVVLSKPTGWKHLYTFISILLIMAAWQYHRIFIYTLLHLHNGIAIIIWWCWRKERYWWEGLSILFCVVLSGIILSGVIEPLELHPPMLELNYFQRTLAPFLTDNWSQRVVILYAFLQSFHYCIWIKLLPEDARKQPSPQSFRKSIIALQQDFSAAGILCIAASMIALACWAISDIEQARTSYLHIISFHGFLELAVGGYILTRK